jgi:hypothetical protein
MHVTRFVFPTTHCAGFCILFCTVQPGARQNKIRTQPQSHLMFAFGVYGVSVCVSVRASSPKLTKTKDLFVSGLNF